MADAKITELDDLPTPAGADLFAMVDDVVGTATTKKATLTNVQTTILAGETDPIFLALSGPFLKTADEAMQKVSTWVQPRTDTDTISGPKLRTTEDFALSGPVAGVVGIITHTSDTPLTASNYPHGTLYIQYTA